MYIKWLRVCGWVGANISLSLPVLAILEAAVCIKGDTAEGLEMHSVYFW